MFPKISGFTPCDAIMKYCCAKVITLFATQYITRPLENCPRRNINIQGIQAKIICCVLSVGAGLSFCCNHIVIPISMGKTPMERITRKLSGPGGENGNKPNKFNIELGSGAERSVIHPIKGACLTSIVTKRTLYNEKNIGICSSIGKQPAAGLTFSFLYKAIISCCNFILSSPTLFFIFSISG